MKASPLLAWMALLCAVMLALPAAAAPTATDDATDPEPDGEAPRYSASLETWFYGTRTRLNGDSLLNPGNRVARMPGQQVLLDARLNLRAESGPLDMLLTPRLLSETRWPGGQGDASVQEALSGHTSTVQATQAFARLKLGQDTLLAGRELLTWGPATFRSPSNPFYFDSGKTNPLAAMPGVDLVRYTHATGSMRWTGAYVASTSALNALSSAQPDMGGTTVLKMDQQGENYLLSLIAARRAGMPDFTGGFAQVTPGDAWLLYGEFGSSSRTVPSARTVLGGASYTLEGGQVFTAEWLHNSAGLRADAQNLYFQQATFANSLLPVNPAAAYGLLGQTAAQAPRLFGRDYLWLGWQSNPQDNKLYWRAEAAHNLSDQSSQLTFYAEKNLVPQLSAFVVLSHMLGSARTEFGEFIRTRLTVGLKWFAF